MLRLEAEGMKLRISVARNRRGGYTSSCPCLPGCVCQGDTPEEAIEGLVESIRGYIASVSNFVPEHVDYEVVEAQRHQSTS